MKLTARKCDGELLTEVEVLQRGMDSVTGEAWIQYQVDGDVSLSPRVRLNEFDVFRIFDAS